MVMQPAPSTRALKLRKPRIHLRCLIGRHSWWTFRFWPDRLPGWMTLVEHCERCDKLGDAAAMYVTGNK